MLTVEAYQQEVLALAHVLPADEVSVSKGLGRVLAADLVARYPVPPFSNSAMDGFAVRAEDLHSDQTRLRVVGDIPAGARSVPALGRGEAARIMTGAPLPPGADAVVPVEQSDQEPGDVPVPASVVVRDVPAGKNVRYRGEDVEIGDVVLPAGTVWSPAAAASAVSIGYERVPLRRRPRVAILSTGSELVPAGRPLPFGFIPDSNSVLLNGLVGQFGGDVAVILTVSDDPGAFRDALDESARHDVDLIVTSGAVSEGAFEVVRQVLEGQIAFRKVAMQPGKPQACGTVNLGGRDVAFVGLPGNPVSVFVSAWVYVRPLLDAFQGKPCAWESFPLPVLDGWRTPPGRQQYIPVVVTERGIRRAHSLGSGSHLVASLPAATALAVVPADVAAVSPGDVLPVFWVNGQRSRTRG